MKWCETTGKPPVLYGKHQKESSVNSWVLLCFTAPCRSSGRQSLLACGNHVPELVEKNAPITSFRAVHSSRYPLSVRFPLHHSRGCENARNSATGCKICFLSSCIATYSSSQKFYTCVVDGFSTVASSYRILKTRNETLNPLKPWLGDAASLVV